MKLPAIAATLALCAPALAQADSHDGMKMDKMDHSRPMTSDAMKDHPGMAMKPMTIEHKGHKDHKKAMAPDDGAMKGGDGH